MTFEEWLKETFKPFENEPGYDVNIKSLSTGNLRRAWDAGYKSGYEEAYKEKKNK